MYSYINHDCIYFYINWSNFIARKIYFLFRAIAFYDVMKFKIHILKFEYLKNEKSFWK